MTTNNLKCWVARNPDEDWRMELRRTQNWGESPLYKVAIIEALPPILTVIGVTQYGYWGGDTLGSQNNLPCFLTCVSSTKLTTSTLTSTGLILVKCPMEVSFVDFLSKFTSSLWATAVSSCSLAPPLKYKLIENDEVFQFRRMPTW